MRQSSFKVERNCFSGEEVGTSTRLPVPVQNTAVAFCSGSYVPKALKAGALAQLPLLEQEAEPQFPEFGPDVFQCVNTPTLQNSGFIRAVKQEM